MLGNYFTLVHVSRFIHQQCIGHKISELYSQHKQQLCIAIERRPSSNDACVVHALRKIMCTFVREISGPEKIL